MNNQDITTVWHTMSRLLRSHPWHGIPIGDNYPQEVHTYIETVPTDTVKYEIDKGSGFLKVARPQKYSSVCPTLYGFIPQTYCGKRVADYSNEKTGRQDVVGDDDPLDICVLTEKTISHGDIMVRAIPVGGFRMLDGDQADDKIIAVMHGDALYSQWRSIKDCPETFIDRLRHYFLTYKDLPDSTDPICEITHVFDRDEALHIIEQARLDYKDKFQTLESMMSGH